MSDQLLHFADELMSSWWIYLALWGFAALDGFFPAIPSETLVVTAGVFAAATGEPNLYAVIVVAAIGAFVGDHVSYALGRGAGGRLLDRTKPGTKRHAAVLWAPASAGRARRTGPRGRPVRPWRSHGRHADHGVGALSPAEVLGVRRTGRRQLGSVLHFGGLHRR
ncbi:DedA family protein [Kribbella sp. CWNU-51]